jgi:hypothetical protein
MGLLLRAKSLRYSNRMSRIQVSTDTTGNLESIAFPEPVFVKSTFGAHHLHPTNFSTVDTRHSPPDWILAILLFCFLLLAWTQVFFHKRVQQILRAPFSQRFTNQLIRDGNLFRERVAIALGTIYLLALSLLLYEFNQQVLGLRIHPFEGFNLYLLILVLIIVLSVLKVILMQFLGSIFRTRETTSNYLLNILIFASLTGPGMTIMLVFITYLQSTYLFYICISFLAVILLFRFIRGFYIGLALTKFSYLFLFVYLCTLEILPLLVLVKVLLNQVKATGG